MKLVLRRVLAKPTRELKRDDVVNFIRWRDDLIRYSYSVPYSSLQSGDRFLHVGKFWTRLPPNLNNTSASDPDPVGRYEVMYLPDHARVNVTRETAMQPAPGYRP